MVKVLGRRVTLGVAILGAASILATAAGSLSRDEAARLQEKVARITKNGNTANPFGARTPITETEVNSYLKYEVSDQLPPGVTDPSIAIVGNGRVSGRALVDLSLVGQERGSRGVLDPLSYLTGQMPVAVSGVLHTKTGVAAFELESASISGVPIPKRVLQELVSYFSRSSTVPNGVSLDDPFPLPAGIREIEVGQGQAIIVQ